MKINLLVTKEDGDLIVSALAELPFRISSTLIHKLQIQANEQLNKKDNRKYDDISNEKLNEIR